MRFDFQSVILSLSKDQTRVAARSVVPFSLGCRENDPPGGEEERVWSFDKLRMTEFFVAPATPTSAM
jgi:hypothetical protein